MSSIKLESNASGTGVFTIASPNSNSNRTLTLPDATGTIITTAGGAAISGTTGTFTGLVDISAAGAGQIQFPATQNASSNANTLDDYEEGTWTPALSFGGGTTGITYSGQTGTYVKIGRLVFLSVSVILSNKGSSTGNAKVTGLPFTPIGVGGVQLGFTENLTFDTIPCGYVSGSTIELWESKTSVGASTITNSDFANNTYLYFSTTYQT